MDPAKERDELRRIEAGVRLERAEGLVRQYRYGIDHFRAEIDACHQLIGYLTHQLGEPEPGGET